MAFDGAVLLDVAAAAAVGALSGMGIGGGTLLVIYLDLIRRMDAPLLRSTNLLFFLFAGGAALPFHLGRIREHTVLALGLMAALPAAAAGTLIGLSLPRNVLRILLGVLLLAGGASALCGSFAGKKAKKSEKTAKK